MSRSPSVRRILQACFPDINPAESLPYFSEVGDAVEGLVYSQLFWPDLLEFHGAVFLALLGNDEVEIPVRFSVPVGDGHPGWPPLSWKQAVDSFNVFEIEHLFRQLRGPAEFFYEAHWELGKVLMQTWQARLTAQYPERRFVVRVIEADEAMDLRIAVSQEFPPLVPPARWDERRRAIIIGGTASQG